MLVLLAWKTLLSDRRKFVAGVLGVVFSIVLANIQGGLFWGLISKASILIDRSEADIWVGHKGMHNVDFPYDIPKRWIYRLEGIPEIDEADWLAIGFSRISLPGGSFEDVVVVGVEEGSQLGRVWEEPGRISAVDQLRITDGVIVDQYDASKLRSPQVGETREIGGRQARIAGTSRGILSFLVAPYVFTTLDRAHLYTGKDVELCSYFLIKVRPHADLKAVCEEIESRLPFAEAMTSSEYASESGRFWLTRTGIGISFGAATFLGLIVGLVMVAQTLYSMVLDRISEFATLKAIGASEKEVVAVLFCQSTGMSLIGIAVGLILSLVLAESFNSPRAPIHLTTGLLIGSSIGVYGMCLIAAAFPYWRVRRVDAHSVLQGS